jgi:hypothetical protein
MTDLTKIDTPFGELDRETKGALMLAAHEGEEIEYSSDGGNTWTTAQYPAWGTDIAYRVKPVPFTLDTIDWSQVADGWDWMARDENGKAFLFRSEPRIQSSAWAVDIGKAEGVGFARVTQSSYRQCTCDWPDSLLRRPEE